MKLFRYRKPSVNTLLGITKTKRKIKKVTGISTLERHTKPSRIKQRVKYEHGLYSPIMRVFRQTFRGNLPFLLGLFKNRSKK